MGTLTPVQSNKQYKKYRYVYNQKTYNGIHVFTTTSNQSIAPAISTTKADLSTMNPVKVPANKVIAKINGCMMNYKNNKFFGFFYQGVNQKLYVEGVAYNSYTEIPNDSWMFGQQYWPCFCVKKDGGAMIRWFKDHEEIGVALPYCDYIIASCHALVYDGICVYDSYIMDKNANEGIYIYNIDRPGTGDRFNNDIDHSVRNRTLLGHKPNNTFVLVCTDDAVPVDVAARLMKDLECDYAVNMDGGTPSQMRIASGYGLAGQVTASGGCAIHTAVCAYNK